MGRDPPPAHPGDGGTARNSGGDPRAPARRRGQARPPSPVRDGRVDGGAGRARRPRDARSTSPRRRSSSPASARPTSPTSTPTFTSSRSSCGEAASTSSTRGGGVLDLAPRPGRLGDRHRLRSQARGDAAPLRQPSRQRLRRPPRPLARRLLRRVASGLDGLGAFRPPRRAATEEKQERHWRLGQVVDAVAGAGLSVTRLVEFQTLYKWMQRDRRVPWEFALLAEKRE